MVMGKVIRVVAAMGAAVVLAGVMQFDAAAAKNPAKASVKCRKAIAKNVLKATTTGLKAIQKCHARQLKTNAGGDCNALAGGAFDQAQAAAVARIGVACRDGDPVLKNYTPPVVNTGLPPVFDRIQAELEQSGKSLQSLPGFQGDPEVKAKAKCSSTVGTARTAVVTAGLKAAFKCQGNVDKSASTFGPLDASCAAGSGGAGGKASGKVSKACGSLSGLDVGSCAGLPGCIVTDGEATAQAIARLAFGGAAVCGNGTKDIGEACDDGNTVEADGCRANCQLPICGDLSVNDPSEQCDEEDGIAGDQQNENCFECKLNVCGDGNQDLQEPGVEECDDGNTVAGDGCTNCTMDLTLCDANGLTVTLALDYPVQQLGGVQATTLELGYPTSVSIPGSGQDASVRQRVTSLLPPAFLFSARDTDSVARAEARAPDLSVIEPQNVAQVRFDCAQGTAARASDFPCTIADLVDRSGAQFDPQNKALAHCNVTLGGSPAPTTTTTSVTSTTAILPPTTTTTLAATCGNGMTDAGEECDDGNTNTGDGCNACVICGNNNITAPETCDDGNTAADDNCPEDCQIGACTPTAAPVQTITITASRADLTSIRFFLDYPDGQVALAGGPGPDLPAGTLTDTPGDPTPVDLEHAIRVLVSAGFTFDTTTIGKLNFLGCAGASVPPTTAYKCTVLDASDGNFQNVTGVTCAVN
jgi:cysteine-rich repeat protein